MDISSAIYQWQALIGAAAITLDPHGLLALGRYQQLVSAQPLVQRALEATE